MYELYSSIQMAALCCMFSPWRSPSRSRSGRRSRARARARSPSARSAWSPLRSRSSIPIFTAEGRGATITDVDGNTFIDFTGGVGCLNVGHSHPRVVEAAQEQLARFSHTDFTIVPYEIYVELAERLIAVAPFSGPAKAAFFNAGTEAVENSIKFARSYTKRTGGDRVRGRLPWPHAPLDDDDLEDASVQGGPRPVRPRGLPRPVSARLPRDRRRVGAEGARGARS